MLVHVPLQLCLSRQVRCILTDTLIAVPIDTIILSYPNDKISHKALVCDMITTRTFADILRFFRSLQHGLPILRTRSWAPSGVSIAVIECAFID
ncbi:hypothetical protein AZE42_11629 [Rhizopogon vesiculosus]|uniref:Uncharacterized protein n=1 Tax=Rhizopogon vesiculosus TaxID=180088 RepID=A0A1J8R6M5_9AGAM|nr:hypothetical protein AZE42_11629 [Rhizopogon vesiculosus]